jgi:hypothetical protein
MKRIALATALAFGCAAARPPVTAPVETIPVGRVALAEPQLELWMEGTGPIDPAESARALDQSRDALAQALSGRGLEVSDPDELLVVRARAIARTDERKSAQTWSFVAIVFVVVAVVVVTVLTSRPRGTPPSKNSAQPIGTVPGRPVPYAPVYHPYVPGPPVGFAFGLSVAVPQSAPPVPWAVPSEQWLASRGWFEGDAVELTVELVDPRTGAIRWQQILKESADPRDPAAMTKLVDRVLAGLPFGEKQGSSAPPEISSENGAPVAPRELEKH